MNTSSKTPVLDRVTDPAQLRSLSRDELKHLAADLRQETVDVVSVTGGHLGAGLGVVELTVALHRVFDTPNDRLIWDVGHQSYPHKILTGRRCAHEDAAPGRRYLGIHQALRERLRPVRRGALLDIDLGGRRICGGARSRGREAQRHRRDRRRRDERGHGV